MQFKNYLLVIRFLFCLFPFIYSPLGLSQDLSRWKEIIDNQSFDELIQNNEQILEYNELAHISQLLWQKYLKKVNEDENRKQEMQSGSISYGDKAMRFSFEQRGVMPSAGYPLYIALHGGGGAPAGVNDGQWQHMKVYYRDSVANGIYLAPRGVTNTWNLHFVEESYPLYDHLIENLIALKSVDPNRVYLLGFSAGGDGVYQIVPRMTDRWAAANMSAGHHNWIKFDNLYNTPFLIQMGQHDGAYHRNTTAVENLIELQRLQNLRGGYPHELFLHYNGSHNSWRDNDPSGGDQTVVANPKEWLAGGSATTAKKNTNAIHWLKNFSRNPYPQTIYWNKSVIAPRNINMGKAYLTEQNNHALLRTPQNLMYWLHIDNAQTTDVIKASFDPSLNQVNLSHCQGINQITVLLRHKDMVDFNKEISITIDDWELDSQKLSPNLKTLTQTLLERGDPNFIFHSEIKLTRDASDRWQVE